MLLLFFFFFCMIANMHDRNHEFTPHFQNCDNKLMKKKRYKSMHIIRASVNQWARAYEKKKKIVY